MRLTHPIAYATVNFGVLRTLPQGYKHFLRRFCDPRRTSRRHLPANGLGSASGPLDIAFSLAVFVGHHPAKIPHVRDTRTAHETFYAVVPHGARAARPQYAARRVERIAIRQRLRCGVSRTGRTTGGGKSSSG